MATSTRTIGKGRILGSARDTTLNPAVPQHVRKNDGLLSPSASTLSLDSSNSTSGPSSVFDNDISAAIAVQARETAEAAPAKLVCPICSDEMVTLLQLNRHLDDDHKHLEEVEQDEVKTWFKTQVIKAKKFQPLAALNQKLKGLEVFESNEEQKIAPTVQTPQSGPAPPKVVDADDLVTKEHWQRYTRDGCCSDPMCGKRLGGSNGNINCRKCGKLFCDEHTLYQMKLSRSAQHEPVRGSWLRVCETCYKSREGYNDHNGVVRDHTDMFKKTRRAVVDKNYLEVSRLEKRLTKVTQILSDPTLQQDQGMVSYLWSYSARQPDQKRLAEQSVVDWEDDMSVSKCPFCQQEFSSYSFRRHHCRTCGRVICADPETACSIEIGFDVAVPPTENAAEKSASQLTSVAVRMCRDCRDTIFSKSDFAKEIEVQRPDERAFNNLKQFEIGIKAMLPRFQKILLTLQDPDNPPSPPVLAEAAKVRKRLTDAFHQYSIAAKRIRDMPTTRPIQLKLQQQVYAQASQFIHIHMLPLKSVPRMLKQNGHHSHSHTSSSSSITTLNNFHAGSPLHGQPNGHNNRNPSHLRDTSPSVRGPTMATAEQEKRKEELREQMVVLEEQKYLVEGMLKDAQRRRKFEEVESLARNLEDLRKEVLATRTALDEG